MFADTDIFPKKEHSYLFHGRSLCSVLVMVAALLLSACTANNGGMGGIEKAVGTQNAQPDNNSGTPAPTNVINPQSAQEVDSNQIAADQSRAQPAQVPLPTQPPSHNDKAVESSQQTPLTDNGTANNHPLSTGNSGVPIVSPTTETASGDEPKPKKTALFSFLGKKTKPAASKDTPRQPTPRRVNSRHNPVHLPQLKTHQRQHRKPNIIIPALPHPAKQQFLVILLHRMSHKALPIHNNRLNETLQVKNREV
ncbi:hypothetical protein RAM19_05125 [Bartonella apihabitans]|nr:hypothetical protein [Bartonella apihabitans]WLT09525.1 hypothetical protein RAM19_05125 [Bartonella apihabitans]